MARGAAFVAGATGYTGRAVVERLVADGFEAVAHVRPDSSRLASEREALAVLPGRTRKA